jgi:hypothetical protein
MNLKKITLLFLFLAFSTSSFSANYEGYFIDEDLDYPAFIGECSALLQIYIHGKENQEVYKENYQKYMTLIDNLNHESEKQRSFGFQESFFSKLSGIEQPTEEEYWGLRSDMSVCAYWTGAQKYQYFNSSSDQL